MVVPILDLAPQITDVAIEKRIAPNAEFPVHAVLVDFLRISLELDARRQELGIQHRLVVEALRAEYADAAIAEDPIQHEGCLAKRAAALISLEGEVLEAGESAGLEVIPAVD